MMSRCGLLNYPAVTVLLNWGAGGYKICTVLIDFMYRDVGVQC